MFEQGIRLKLRFNYKGLSTIEDLWEIPVVDKNNEYISDLNDIFCELDAIKQQRQKGLYCLKTKEDEIIDLKMAIIEHIFETKKQEHIAYKNVIVKAKRKQKLLGIIAEKQDASLHNMPIEELNKLIDEL